MSDKKAQSKAGPTVLSEEDLDQAQGGGSNLFQAGTGGLDLKKTQPSLKKPGKNFPQIDDWIPDVDDW